MGWKNIKSHYEIDHIVHINNDGNICIGTIKIPEIIVIDKCGKIIKPYNMFNNTLLSHQDDIKANPMLFVRLFMSPDVFKEELTTFYYFTDEALHEAVGYVHDSYALTKSGSLINANFSINKDKSIIDFGNYLVARQKEIENSLSQLNTELEILKRQKSKVRKSINSIALM